MNQEIKVDKITLNLKGKAVELSVEDARKLQAELDALLGAKTVVSYPAPIVIERTIPISQPQPIWYQPNTVPIYPSITCGAIGTSEPHFHTSGYIAPPINNEFVAAGCERFTN